MSILRRFVDLRPGEGRLAALTATILGLTISAHTMLETARDALFLAKLPPNRLTLVYGLLAVLSLVFGVVSSTFARRFGRRAALVVSLLVCAFAIVLLELRPVTPAMVFTLYALSGVIGTVLSLQFWMLAGDLFSVTQGKRLFGPIGAGGVVGAAVGGAAAAGLLRVLPVQNLLLVAAALFTCAAALVARTPSDSGADAGASVAGTSSSAFGWARDLRGLFADAYVVKVGLMTAVGTAAVLVADYLFKSSAAATIPKDELGSFFALFYAVNNAVALVVQLFVTSAVIKRLGVTGAVVVLPFLLVLGGSGAALGGGFALALASKGADGAFRHSLQRVTSELLLLPLPAAVRSRSKPVFDTLFGRGVQALVAAGILGLSALSLATPSILGAILAALSALWVVVALMVRKPYVDLFRRALAAGNIDVGSSELDLASVEALMEALSSRDEERVLAGIDVLAEGGRSRILPALILYHDSPIVLERALTVLASPDRRDWIQLAERLMQHQDVTVRATALRALAGAGVREAALRGLEDESPKVRACAAFFLAGGGGEGAPELDPRVEALFGATGQDGLIARRELLGVIGDHGDARWVEVVRRIIASDGQKRGVAAVAAAAIVRTEDATQSSYLITQLAVRDGRGAVSSALVSLGEPAFEELEKALADPTLDDRVRRQVPKTIGRFGTQRAVDILTRDLLSGTSGSVRYKSLRALGRLSTDAHARAGERLVFDRAGFHGAIRKTLVEYVRVTALGAALGRTAEGESVAHAGVGRALLALLSDKAQQSLERVFRLLQLAHRNEDFQGVHAAVVRGDARARGNALEFLDSLPDIPKDVRRVLQLVADDLEPLELVRRAGEVIKVFDEGAPTAHDQAVALLFAEPDELLAALAAYHALEAGIIALGMRALAALEQRPELRLIGAVPVRTRRDSQEYEHG